MEKSATATATGTTRSPRGIGSTKVEGRLRPPFNSGEEPERACRDLPGSPGVGKFHVATATSWYSATHSVRPQQGDASAEHAAPDFAAREGGERAEGQRIRVQGRLAH